MKPGLKGARLRSVAAVLLSICLLVCTPRAGFGQVACESLKDFGVLDQLGDKPNDLLLVRSEGALCGTTYRSGSRGLGTVFRISTNGTGFRVLHHFGDAGDGQNPEAGLMQAADGNLYGTTRYGSAGGTVFRLAKDGTGYQVIYRFDGGGGGSSPAARLTQGLDIIASGTTTTAFDSNAPVEQLFYRVIKP